MKRILIIDDEPDIIKTVKFRLIKAGYEVFVAVNGQEGLEKTKEIMPNLILLDYSMPILNGEEVCKKIRADDKIKSIPIILMTASSQRAKADNSKVFGVDDVLLKPFEAEELYKKINNLIEGSNQ